MKLTNDIFVPNFTKILVIDDDLHIQDVISEILSIMDLPHSITGETSSAKRIIGKEKVDIIISDITLPGESGIELLQWCRSLNIDTPFVLMSGTTEPTDLITALNLGTRAFIHKPFDIALIEKIVKEILGTLKYNELHRKFINSLQSDNRILEEKVKARTEEIVRTQDVAILSLASLAEIKDSETGKHIERTRSYIKCLAEYLRNHENFKHYLNDRTIELLYRSAPLHDLGKIGIPDAILTKKGKLTKEEYEVIKQHPELGGKALEFASNELGSNSFLTVASQIAYEHHEKWDGSGYPKGLKGSEISIPARLMALADVYDALISRRCYKDPIPFESTRDLILNERGKHFDPDVVDAFLKLEKEFIGITEMIGQDCG